MNAELVRITIREGQEVAAGKAWRGPELSQGGSEGFLAVGSHGSEDSEGTWGLEGAQRPRVDVGEGGMGEIERSWMRRGEDTKSRKAVGPEVWNSQLKV